ncbi:MAG: hypothetical protein ACFB10_26115 [Salibacteraceae bacterium]
MFNTCPNYLTKSVLALAFCGLTLPTFAQSTNNVHALNLAPTHIPQSPDAASLGQYGSHPVSNYTGTPQIQIPLHTLQGRTLSWPIGLSYHASGLKVEQIASSVGAGWSLQGVGSISRQIRHLTDFGITGMTNGLVSGSHQLPVSVDIGSFPPTNTCQLVYEDGTTSGTGYGSGIGPLEMIYLTDQYDLEPDAFFYNFGPYGGKFLFDRNKQALFEKPFFVTMTHPTMDADGWTFVTPDGYTYTFGSSADGCVEWTEYLMSVPNSPYATARNQATAWYLKSVESPDGERISFEYQPYVLSYDPATQFSFTKSSVFPNAQAYHGLQRMGRQVDISGRLISKITLENAYIEERIEFSYMGGRNDLSGAMRLSEVKVYRKNLSLNTDQLIKSFQLTHHNESNRLWLASVQELGSNGMRGDRIPPHTFTYNQRAQFPGHRSKAKDYWGYFNGKAPTAPLYPSSYYVQIPAKCYFLGQEYEFSGGSDRSADAIKMQYGSLSRIDYPTGGYTLFDYEPHQFSNASYAGQQIGGGLRIQRITTYASATDPAPMVKKYEYSMEQEGQAVSSGKLLWRPTHVMPAQLPDPGSNNYWNNKVAPYMIYNTQSLVQGTINVGYEKVTVLHGENGENGKESFSFFTAEQIDQNLSTGHTYDGSPTFMTGIPSQSYDFRNGSLIEQIVYSNEAGSFLPKHRKLNSYQLGNIGNPSSGFSGVAHGLKLSCPLITGQGIENSNVILTFGSQYTSPCLLVKFNYYDINVKWPRLAQSEEKVWGDNGQALITTTQYAYNNPNHERVSEITTTNSNGEVVKKIVTYPHDHSGTYYGTDMAALQNDNFRYLPISEYYEVDGQTVYHRIFSYDNQGHRTAVYDWNRSTNSFDQLAHFSYDASGRLAGLQPERGVETAYRWHNAYPSPVAEIKNANLSETIYGSFEALGISGVMYSENNVESVYGSPSGSRAFRTDQGNLLISGLDAAQSYTLGFFARGNGNEVWVDYQPGTGGPYEHQQPLTGDWVYYRITISGTSELEIESPPGSVVHLDELRLAPVDAMYTTFVYNDRQELVSILDDNGQHLAFEYDDLGRLILKRDAEGNILERTTYHYFNN